MPLPKLDLAPESTRFSAACGSAILRAAVAGGRSRGRLDQLGAPFTVNCQWQCTVGEFAYLGAFYRSLINHGSEPFLIDLPIGYAMPAEQEAKFLPGSFNLSSISGATHFCSASLEVKAPVRNAVEDAALVAARAAAVGGLPVMAITPSLESYGVQRGQTMRRFEPGMGPSVQRLDRFNTASVMTVAWNTNPAGFDYLSAFYFTAVREGALPFLIESVHDHPDPRWLNAVMLNFSLESINGLTYSARSDVEVVPIASPDYDGTVLTLHDEFGDEWPDFLLDLDRLVNVDMPTWD